ncbi:nitrite reductase [Moniliophthora roreri]|nr:nitrite reductase [Moniliophthora roreri]
MESFGDKSSGGLPCAFDPFGLHQRAIVYKGSRIIAVRLIISHQMYKCYGGCSIAHHEEHGVCCRVYDIDRDLLCLFDTIAGDSLAVNLLRHRSPTFDHQLGIVRHDPTMEANL